MPHQGSGGGNDFGPPRIRLPTADRYAGGRTVAPTVAWDLVQTFLAAEFCQTAQYRAAWLNSAALEAA
jgi:hypothetical protein